MQDSEQLISSRSKKVQFLHNLLMKQKQTIDQLHRENAELRRLNEQKDSQIRILNIRLDSYSVPIAKSQYSFQQETMVPQLSIAHARLIEQTVISTTNRTTDNNSLNYTSDRVPPVGSDDILPTLTDDYPSEYGRQYVYPTEYIPFKPPDTDFTGNTISTVDSNRIIHLSIL